MKFKWVSNDYLFLMACHVHCHRYDDDDDDDDDDDTVFCFIRFIQEAGEEGGGGRGGETA